MNIASQASNFAAIDDLELQQSFTRAATRGPKAPNDREAFIVIEGMSCAACAFSIQKALGSQGGVRSVDINIATGSARLIWGPESVSLSHLFGVIASLGYKPFPADDFLAQARRNGAQRTLLWQFLVALLAMMQTMMYAWPAYVAEPGELAADIARLFNWASWLMCLPLLIFSSRPFFASAWAAVRRGAVSMDLPIALAILITFGASSYAMYSGGETYFDSLAMFVTFLLAGRLWESQLRARIGRELNALARRLPVTVEIFEPGASATPKRVPAHALRHGDRIRVAVGEAIPADARVETGESTLDEALLTGESAPVWRRPGDTVLSGSYNLGAPLVLQVIRVGKDSRYGQIVELMERAACQRPPLVQLADRYAHYFLIAVLALAALATFAWWWAGSAHALWIGVSVLIVTCPCALSLAAPVSLLAATNRVLKSGVLVAQPAALETIARATDLVFDKTGTLSRGELRLIDIKLGNRGFDTRMVIELAASLERGSLHPVARALRTAQATQRAGRSESDSMTLDVTEVRELPGSGVCGLINGKYFRLGKADSANSSGSLPAQLAIRTEAYDANEPNDATEVIAAGEAIQAGGSEDWSLVELSDDSGVLARFYFADEPRPDARVAVAELVRRGLAVSLCSGDRPGAVKALAAAVGIGNWQANYSPEDKYQQVRGAQRQGKTMIFVGDGVNDAPAIGASDVSIAMGSGTPIAQSRADVILLSNRIGDLVRLRDAARATMKIIRQNLGWALAYNLVCVPIALMGWLPPWAAGLGMAASSVLVLLNSTRLLR